MFALISWFKLLQDNLSSKGMMFNKQIFLILFKFKYIMDSGVIAQQIEQLKANKNVQRVDEIKPKCYQIIYSPQLSNSPYSHLTFKIQVELPRKYPQVPPSLYFMDNIYHLNIDPKNGQVFMPILNEDWSPFLTLSAILQSIDSILQQPDLNYPASQSILNQYEYEPEIYFQRIQQMLNASQSASKLIPRASSSFVEDVQVIDRAQPIDCILINSSEELAVHLEDVCQNRITQVVCDSQEEDNYQVGSLKQGASIKKNEAQQMKEEMKIIESQQGRLDSNVNDHKISSEVVSPLKKQEQLDFNLNGNKVSSMRDTPEQKQLNMSKSQMVDQNYFKSSNKLLKMQTIQKYEQIELNLKKADDLLCLFMRECQSMENIIKNTRNSRIKQLLQKKLTQQLQMIEQIVDISSQLKSKLFFELKNKTKGLLN